MKDVKFRYVLATDITQHSALKKHLMRFKQINETNILEICFKRGRFKNGS